MSTPTDVRNRARTHRIGDEEGRLSDAAIAKEHEANRTAEI